MEFTGFWKNSNGYAFTQRRLHEAVMRLYYASEERELSREEVDQLLFWVDAWEKAEEKYKPQI